jgi:hypothetical protein
MNRNLVSTILKGIAIAMAIAVIVLNLLGTLGTTTAFNLLGLGLAALAIAALQKE